MATPLQQWIESLPVVDVHEHHMPQHLHDTQVGLWEMFHQTYANWTRRRDPEAKGWAGVKSFLEECGSNAFVRNLVRTLQEIYEFDDEITESNWLTIDQQIRRRHSEPKAWAEELLTRANIAHIITDPFACPLIDARKVLGARYSSVLRINNLCLGWHPEVTSNNLSARSMLAEVDMHPATFDEYLSAIDRLVDAMSSRNQVGFKSAVAYERTIDFDDPDEALARRAWGKREPTAAEKKAFGDVVTDRICRHAAEREIPFQIHTGSALVRTSRAMNVAGLVERHPKTKFVLMHMGFPWGEDLLALAFAYPNVWLDICWAPLLSPTFFERTLHEMIESVPDESRLMIGGDNWHAEETYGAISAARRMIGEVLQQKVTSGYFRESDARRLARKILSTNAAELYRLPIKDLR